MTALVERVVGLERVVAKHVRRGEVIAAVLNGAPLDLLVTWLLVGVLGREPTVDERLETTARLETTPLETVYRDLKERYQ